MELDKKRTAFLDFLYQLEDSEKITSEERRKIVLLGFEWGSARMSEFRDGLIAKQ